MKDKKPLLMGLNRSTEQIPAPQRKEGSNPTLNALQGLVSSKVLRVLAVAGVLAGGVGAAVKYDISSRTEREDMVGEAIPGLSNLSESDIPKAMTEFHEHMYSEETVQLQNFLEKYVGFSFPEKGYYGSMTSDGVRALQVFLGVKADGLWGPVTVQALKDLESPQQKPSTADIMVADQQQ